MKGYQFLILLISINFIFSDYCDGDEPDRPTKAEDCSSHKKDGGYCCLVKGVEHKDSVSCQPFGPNSYKYIVDKVKFFHKCFFRLGADCVENKDFSIDCKSYYLAFSSLTLLFLFL